MAMAGEAQFVPDVRARIQRLTLPRLWAICAVAIPVLGALATTLGMVDLGYLVRTGQTMLSSGHLVTTDSMSFTAAGTHWVNQQWGAEVILALVYRAGGLAALAIL